MKKLSTLVIIVLAVLGQAFSQVNTNIDEPTARRTATAFVQSRSCNRNNLQLVSSSNIYIYNIGEQGFVIVSGNTVLPPVLGYSDQGTFPSMEDAPENFRSWIEHYSEMIDFAIANGIAPDAKVQRQWDEAAIGIFPKSNRSVNPLVSTRWNQDCYYNEYCPEAAGWGWGGWGGGPCGHVYAGCVACAMAQVMKYWDHPAHGYGSHSYVHSEYGQQSADFGNTTYQWSQMPDEIYDSNNAIATLMYHCGVSVNMNYSPSGSGAYSNDVETALRSYFGYCGAKYRMKSSYTDEGWDNMLMAELDLSHPIYYSGAHEESGHAFVCDGYDNDGLMHFNFGWSGSGDGYYSTLDVNSYNQGQAVVVNIYPVAIQADANGIIYVTTDGTGDGSSWANATSNLEIATSRSNGNNVKVWVKKGTYYGDVNNPEGAFYITENNLVYGSFNGDEAPNYDISQRDFVNNASILDGQGERRVLWQENNLSAGTAAMWDGFTLQNGSSGNGAGAYLNNHVTLSNCTIRDNHTNTFGGGLYLNSGGSMARTFINNCTITGNSASMGGGVCDRVGGTFTNCNICNNTASTKGGGLYLYINTEPTLTNCIFANNTAKSAGAIYDRGILTASNCDFVMNYGLDSIGGVFNENHYNSYTNCIFWGNKAKEDQNQLEGESRFEYCAVQGGVEGTEIINLAAENDGEEPGFYVRFSNPAEGAGTAYQAADWTIQARSICLNAGKPNTIGVGVTDIYGNPRIQNGCIEIGAYESCAPLTLIEETVHENESYEFHGQNLTEPGYYTVVLEGADCDSVVGLTLAVTDGITESSDAHIQVWPNPTTGLLTIQAEGIQSVEVFNMMGQLVLQAIETQTISIESLEKGVYFLRVCDRFGNQSIVKVVKE